MSPDQRQRGESANFKLCPICEQRCERGDSECPSCGHEFSSGKPKYKTCEQCEQLNPLNVDQCQFCGNSFTHDFEVTLKDALRVGAIVRGLDLEEEEVVEGEKYKDTVGREILKTGDENLLKILQTLPYESWGRLKKILDED
jgi:RNA polymerase subunit RPABC4/transcription elongation factor Spt4